MDKIKSIFLLFFLLLFAMFCNIGFATVDYFGDLFDNSDDLMRVDIDDNDGLLGYWAFDTDLGGIVADYSGNGHNGTIVNGTWTSQGHRLGGMDFNENNDRIVVSDSASLDITTNQFTIEGWFKPEIDVTDMLYPYPSLLTKRPYEIGGYVAHFMQSTGKIVLQYCYTGGCKTIYSQTEFKANNWYHYIGTYDGQNMSLYINGILENYSNDATEIIGSNIGKDLLIGYNFNGTIDEVKIYDRALTSTEAYEHFKDKSGVYLNSTTPTKPYVCDENTVALWHFDGSATDSCGTNDGTLLNGTSYDIGKFGSQGVSFDGVDDYIDVGNDSSLNIIDELTIDVWVKPEKVSGYTSTFRTILSKGVHLNQTYGLYWDSHSHEIEFVIHYSHDRITLPYSYIDRIGQWTHFLVVYDNSYVQIYANGVFLGSKTLTTTIPIKTATLTVGFDGTLTNDRYFKGTIDELRISNIARTPNEIYEHYQQGLYTHHNTYNNTLQTWQNISWSESLPVAHYPIVDSMVAYWKFEGNTKDATVNGNDGTVYGANLTEKGKVGQGYEFDGVNDYINCGNANDELIFGSDEHSYSVWAKYDGSVNTEYSYFVATGMSNAGEQSGFGIREGKLYTSAYSTPIAYSTYLIPDLNEWHNYVMKYLDGTTYFYIDGVLVDSKSISLDTTIGKCRIGCHVGSTSFFNGTIDEVAIYNKALSEDDIKKLYETTKIYFQTRTSSNNKTWTDWTGNTPIPQTYEENRTLFQLTFDNLLQGYNKEKELTTIDINKSGLVGYWKLDNNARDYSGYGNDGTIYGASSTSDGFVDGAMEFDGDDYIRINNPLNQDNLEQEWTVLAWVNIKDTGNDQFLIEGLNAGLRLVCLSTDKLLLYLNGGVNDYYDYSDQAGLLTNKGWKHVAFVFRNSDALREIYINGIEHSTTGPNHNSIPLGISSTLDIGELTNGKIDEVAIYNRALSSQEITQIYSKSKYKYGKFLSAVELNESDSLIYPVGMSKEDDTVLLCHFDGNYLCDTGQKAEPVIDYSNMDDIVSAWSFDEYNSTHVFDSSGFGNDGILSNLIIKNGDAETGTTYAWSSFDGVTSDDAQSGEYSFYEKGYKTFFNSDFIPIDLNKTYYLSGWFKSYGVDKSRIYFGFAPFDENKEFIAVNQVYNILNTETTLYEDCLSSDKIIKITDASNWATGLNRYVAFNVDDSGNYNDLPNRELSNRDIIRVEDMGSYWEVEFNANVGKAYTAGTKVRQHNAGASYMYVSASSNYPSLTEWTKYTDTSGVTGESLYGIGWNNWYRGTRYVKILLLANYQQSTDYKLYIDNITLTETPIETSEITTGPFNLARDFNGIRQYIDTQNNFNFTSELTYSAWVKIHEYEDTQKIISKRYDNDNFHFLGLNSDGLYAGVGAGTLNNWVTTTHYKPNINEWHHVTFTYKNSDKQAKIYVDGVLQINDTLDNDLVAFDANIYIGRDFEYDNYFNGSIDEVLLFNRSLTEEEIQGLYTFQKGKYDTATYSTENSYLTINDSQELDITDEITLEAWIKPKTQYGSNRIIAKTGTSSPMYDIFMTINNKLGTRLTNSSGYSNYYEIPADLTIDEWNYIAMTYDSSTNKITLYKDGEQIGTSTTTIRGPLDISDGNLLIGSTTNQGGSFNGSIDEVRISNTAKSPQEIYNSYLSNINAETGTISFYVKPNWDGDDNTEHTFFDEGNFKIYKDTSNYLAFQIGNAETYYDISSWQEDTWYQIGATWDVNSMTLIINGEEQYSTSSPSIQNLTSFMFLGNSEYYNSSCNCTIDDFNIYNYAKTPSQTMPKGYTNSTGEEMNIENSQYLQYRALFYTTDSSITPSFNYVSFEHQDAVKYVYPTPEDNSKYYSSTLTVKVDYGEFDVTSCTLNYHYNNSNYVMQTTTTDCQYTLDLDYSTITNLIYNVSYIINGETLHLPNQQITFYPDHSQNIIPFGGLSSFIFTLLTILIGGFILN